MTGNPTSPYTTTLFQQSSVGVFLHGMPVISASTRVSKLHTRSIFPCSFVSVFFSSDGDYFSVYNGTFFSRAKLVYRCFTPRILLFAFNVRSYSHSTLTLHDSPCLRFFPACCPPVVMVLGPWATALFVKTMTKRKTQAEAVQSTYNMLSWICYNIYEYIYMFAIISNINI